MTQNAGTFLGAWSTFYTTAANAAAALTGLMFVVITLITGGRRLTQSNDGIATFSTPTVLHFSAALLVSLLISAPWKTLAWPAILIGLVGLYGVVHIGGVVHRSRKLETYRPDLEDWVCYSILPAVAYAAILIGALVLPLAPSSAMFGIAGGVLILIFIGIRNSWDVVTYVAIDQRDHPEN